MPATTGSPFAVPRDISKVGPIDELGSVFAGLYTHVAMVQDKLRQIDDNYNPEELFGYSDAYTGTLQIDEDRKAKFDDNVREAVAYVEGTIEGTGGTHTFDTSTKDTLVIFGDGKTGSVSVTSGATTTLAQIVTDINADADVSAIVTASAVDGKLRLTAKEDTAHIVIGKAATAAESINDLVGFTDYSVHSPGSVERSLSTLTSQLREVYEALTP